MSTDSLWRDPHGASYREEGWWRGELLTDHVRRWEKSRPTETALVAGTTRLTWAELWQEVLQAGAAVKAKGVTPGDIVSTQLPNGVDIVVLHMALEMIGAIHNPLAVQLREHELDQITRLLEPQLVVFAEHDRVDFAAMHARTHAGATGRTVSVAGLRSPGASTDAIDEATSRPSASDAAFILNTSGTVSMKGVVHTHDDAMYSTRVVGTDLLGLGPDDTVLCVIPMTWGGGLEWGVRLALHTGAKLIAAERWDPHVAADLIDREGVTFLYGPPTIAADIVGMSDEWRPSQNVAMICAGAPIPRQFVRDARERLGLALLPGYGQTEHFHSTLARRDDSYERICTSDGSPLPGVELRTVTDSGPPVEAGSEGELLCRGPNVGAGYWNQPELTAGTFHDDGWQVTQDIGRVDADGYLRVSGRKRDIIIRGGLNVSPREVEELVLRHPDVREVAVIGVPDARYGESICAFIVPVSGHAPDIAELGKALNDIGVARYKHPELVRAIDALPLTSTGKVRHESLRELFAKGDPTDRNEA